MSEFQIKTSSYTPFNSISYISSPRDISMLKPPYLFYLGDLSHVVLVESDKGLVHYNGQFANQDRDIRRLKEPEVWNYLMTYTEKYEKFLFDFIQNQWVYSYDQNLRSYNFSYFVGSGSQPYMYFIMDNVGKLFRTYASTQLAPILSMNQESAGLIKSEDRKVNSVFVRNLLVEIHGYKIDYTNKQNVTINPTRDSIIKEPSKVDFNRYMKKKITQYYRKNVSHFLLSDLISQGVPLLDKTIPVDIDLRTGEFAKLNKAYTSNGRLFLVGKNVNIASVTEQLGFANITYIEDNENVNPQSL